MGLEEHLIEKANKAINKKVNKWMGNHYGNKDALIAQLKLITDIIKYDKTIEIEQIQNLPHVFPTMEKIEDETDTKDYDDIIEFAALEERVEELEYLDTRADKHLLYSRLRLEKWKTK